jgi:hypothetical protein
MEIGVVEFTRVGVSLALAPQHVNTRLTRTTNTYHCVCAWVQLHGWVFLGCSWVAGHGVYVEWTWYALYVSVGSTLWCHHCFFCTDPYFLHGSDPRSPSQ